MADINANIVSVVRKWQQHARFSTNSTLLSVGFGKPHIWEKESKDIQDIEVSKRIGKRRRGWIVLPTSAKSKYMARCYFLRLLARPIPHLNCTISRDWFWGIVLRLSRDSDWESTGWVVPVAMKRSQSLVSTPLVENLFFTRLGQMKGWRVRGGWWVSKTDGTWLYYYMNLTPGKI